MRVVASWRADLDTLARDVAQLESAVVALRDSAAIAQARTAFRASRRAFKHAEIGLEYYAPSTSRALNGPALPDVDEEEGPEAVIAPTGFQVVEELLFADDPSAEREKLAEEVTVLRQLVTRTQTMMSAQLASDDRIWDAAKLEIARIVSLGITGFDSPIAGESLLEADAALEGISRALAPYRAPDAGWSDIDSLMQGARAMLTSCRDRESFDHFAFIVHFANPLARALRDARLAAGIGLPVERRAFAMEAASLFDEQAFDALAFAPIDTKSEPVSRVDLGRALFHDPRLSGDGSRACSSCHIPERAFTDGQRKSQGRTGQPLPRNTPTILNIGLQVGSFSDLRTTFLEDQVTEVVENVDEMHAKLPDVATVLRADAALVSQFRAAFASSGVATDSFVTAARIRSALAAYMRSLTRLNAPIDRALRGDTSAIAADARQGFNVFVGKGKCATCHFLPLTNGTVPPMFQKSDVEVIGVPTRPATSNAQIDPDLGRFRISRAEPHRHAFRTPSLRNVALTAPYMHNGAYRSLESVIDFYNRGGGVGVGVGIDNQTLPASPLRLAKSEQRALLALLRALTDTTATQRRR
jgi:cytochrome c peroxidase